METPRLFDEDELEGLSSAFDNACKKYGYEGAIVIANSQGMKTSHCNVEYGFFSYPQYTTQWNRLSGRD